MRLIDADALGLRFVPKQAYLTDHILEKIDTAPTVCGWISVKDRMPENETIVVALVQYEVGWYHMLAWHDKRGWHSSAEEFQESDGVYVTHWMPLPEPPQEGKAE